MLDLNWLANEDDDDERNELRSNELVAAVIRVAMVTIAVRCYAKYSHYYHMVAAASDLMDFVNQPTNELATTNHYLIVVLDALVLWLEDMQSNYFCNEKSNKKKSKQKLIFTKFKRKY